MKQYQSPRLVILDELRLRFTPVDWAGQLELSDKKQTPADSHHRVLVLSNRGLDQSTIF
jgi:hypothetical protein